MVVIYHYGTHLSIFKDGIFHEFFNHGAVAVSFFFFLSGVVLAYNYGVGTSTKKFFLKRVFRIYPIYVITYILVFIMMLWLGKKTPDIFHAIMNFLALQSWLPGYAMELNYPSWSISAEFFLYATFPLLLYFSKRIKWNYFVLICIAVIVLGWLQHYYFVNVIYDPERYRVNQLINFFPPFHFSTFVAGFLCGKWVKILQKKTVNSWIYSLLATLGILLFILLLNTENDIRTYSHNGGLIPVFMLICIGLALDQKFYKTIFGSKALLYLGNISYGIYMWQFAVFMVFSTFFAQEELSLNVFTIFILVLVLWGAVSYEFIEKPSRKILSGKFLR